VTAWFLLDQAAEKRSLNSAFRSQKTAGLVLHSEFFIEFQVVDAFSATW
jgi:hypothetical protein